MKKTLVKVSHEMISIGQTAVIAVKKKKMKKKKNKETKSVPEGTAPTAAPSQQITVNEIDDLFDTLKSEKKKKLHQKKEEEHLLELKKKIELDEKQALHKKIQKEEEAYRKTLGNVDAQPVRYDEDGLPIYTEDALKIGRGRDTADCPFDCWCCF